MRLRTWIAILFISILILSAALTLIFSVNVIRSQTGKNIKVTKSEYLNFVKSKLQDVTSLARAVAENEFKDTSNWYVLNQRYGQLLKSMVEYEQYVAKYGELKTSSKINVTSVDTFSFKVDAPVYRSVEKVIRKELKDRSSGFLFEPSDEYTYLYFKMSGNSVSAAAIKSDRVSYDAQNICKAQVRHMLYDSPKGYIFMYDDKYRNLVYHFSAPLVEGRSFEDPNVSSANQIVHNLIDQSRKKESAFVEYQWKKPYSHDDETKLYPKLAYVRFFSPWKWTIGTGAYLDELKLITNRLEDDMLRNVNMLIIEVTAATLIITAVMVLFALIFASTISNPISRIIDKIRAFDLNSKTYQPIPPRGCDELRSLCRIFNKMQVSLKNGIANIQQTMTKKERLESRLEIAEAIQESILPRIEPQTPVTSDFDIYGEVVHASPPGGDMYDFFYIDDEHFCFALGDVSEKGVPASMFMLITRTLLRAKAAKGLTAGEIVTEINKSLCASNDKLMYVRFLLGIINVKTGRLSYTNAGQMPAYLQRQTGELEVLPVSHGTALGISTERPYYEENLCMRPGDKIVLVTDGLTAATNYVGDDFGEKRFMGTVNKSKGDPAKNTVRAVLNRVNEFVGTAPVYDDIVVLAIIWQADL
ncbi:SpoIIE family protein phosphatase [Lentisphaerota bacterium ZTH]|nr:SpoIIE family protein phosphatase [Lentisphaerota bacterium]WET06935.1 SpoIIE family protein phosphatase [Lentisphaerota bacterium ZTH]